MPVSSVRWRALSVDVICGRYRETPPGLYFYCRAVSWHEPAPAEHRESRWNTSREPWYSSTRLGENAAGFSFCPCLLTLKPHGAVRERNRGESSAPPSRESCPLHFERRRTIRTRLSRIPTARYLDSNAQKKHRMETRKSEDRDHCAPEDHVEKTRTFTNLSDPPFWYLQFSPQHSLWRRMEIYGKIYSAQTLLAAVKLTRNV